MDSLRFLRILLVSASILLVSLLSTVTAGDIVHHDDLAPKKPGCENDFVLVLISLYPVFLSSCSEFSLFFTNFVKNTNEFCCFPRFWALTELMNKFQKLKSQVSELKFGD